MNERIRPNIELTRNAVSNTLDTRSNMPEPTEPQPEPVYSGVRRQDSSPVPSRPESLTDLMVSRNPQAARETARAIVEEAKAQGKTLTPEQRKLVSELGYEPVLAGGADVSENEGWESGRAETDGSNKISTEGINNENIKKQIEILSQKMRLGFDPEDFKKALDEIYAITGVDPEGEEGRLNQEKQLAVRRLSAKFQEIRESRGETADRFGFYLETQDLRDLDEDAMGWLDKQFDAINNYAKAGSELDSPVLQRIQTEVGEASAYLQKKFSKFAKEKITNTEKAREAEVNSRTLEYFNRVFAVRLNLIYARTTIEQRGMEQIAGAMGRLREGLIGALSFDKGRVGMMYRRMQGELEHLRNAEGGKEHHLHPESLNKLQRILIEEQFDLAKKGLGEYGHDYRGIIADPKQRENADRLLKSEITRSVRTAYDVLVASQRVAIFASRGGALADKKQYFSDNGAVFAVLNLEEMSINKWGLLSHHELKFLEFMKLDLAMNQMDYDVSGLTRGQLIDLGGRLLKELYTVPDYYSASWRMTGIRDQLTRTMRYKAENDSMIKKIIEIDGYTHADARVNQIGERLRVLVSEELEMWKSLHPEGGRLEGDEEIVRRNIARSLFQGELTSGSTGGLTKEERDTLLQVLTPTDMMHITNFVDQRAAQIDSADVADFGLFIQLKQNLGHLGEDITKEQKNAHREKVWGKIQKYKTEDMFRILRSRAKELYSEDMQKLVEMNTLFSSMDPDLVLTGSERVSEKKGGLLAFNSFDKFLSKYGGVIQMVREDGIRNSLDGPKQIDFRELDERHKTMIDRALGVGSAQKLKEIYSAMYGLINNQGLIKEFMTSQKYSDLYSRTLSVDDVMLENLQNVPENSGLLTMEEYWTGEVGGSPTKRNMNDLGNAIEAGNAFIAFMTTEAMDEKYKQSKTMKGKVEAYNGRDNGSQVMRFTYGTELLYSMQDYLVNVLRLGGLPLRQPTSQKQRDAGIGAKTMTRGELRADLDHHMGDFWGLTDHGKWFEQLERLTETDAKGRLKLTTLTLLFYTFLGLTVGLPAGVLKEAVGSTTRS